MARKETISTTEYSYTVNFEPSVEGGYTVTCRARPRLVTEGDALEEAREMAADAIRCCLESPQKDGLPAPAGEDLKPTRREEVVTVRLTAA